MRVEVAKLVKVKGAKLFANTTVAYNRYRITRPSHASTFLRKKSITETGGSLICDVARQNLRNTSSPAYTGRRR